MQKEIYRLQPEDIISIQVASVTESEFDFIAKYQNELGVIRKLGQYNQNFQDGGAVGGQNLGGLNIGGAGAAGNPLSGLVLSGQNTGFTLSQAGELELPEIGKLSLAGLTIPEAEMRIKERLDGYYETPMLRVQLLNYHFTVLGEVENEGRFTSFDPEITVFDAISLAGNIGELADRSNVKIIRREGVEAKVVYLDMLDERTLTADNFYVKRNDIIVVPPLKARTAQRYTLPNIGRTLGFVGAITGVLALVISLSR